MGFIWGFEVVGEEVRQGFGSCHGAGGKTPHPGDGCVGFHQQPGAHLCPWLVFFGTLLAGGSGGFEQRGASLDLVHHLCSFLPLCWPAALIQVCFSEAMSTVPKQRWYDSKPSLSNGTCTQCQQDEEGLTRGRWFPLCSSLLLAWWFGLGEDGTHVVDLLLSVFFLLLREYVIYKILTLVLASLSDLFVSGHSW